MDIIMESLSEASTNRSVIPESCLSFSEMSVYLDEFTNREFNSMLESIGIDELAVFESTGSVVVYEAEKLETLKSKVVDYTKSIWSAYKGFWEKVLAAVKADTKNAKKLGKLTADVVKNLDNAKVYGKTHTFFKAADIKFDSNARKFAQSVNKTFRALANDDHDAAKEAKDMLEDKICEKISGVDGKSNKVMKNNLSKKLIGSEVSATGEWIKKNYSKIEAVVEGGMLSNVKADYNAEKKVFADVVSMAATVDNNVSGIIEPWSKMLGETVSVMHACYAVEMDVCRRELREYINIMTKVLGNKPVAECCDANNAEECQTAEIKGDCKDPQHLEVGGANNDAMPDNKVPSDAEGSEKKLEVEPIENKQDADVVSEGMFNKVNRTNIKKLKAIKDSTPKTEDEKEAQEFVDKNYDEIVKLADNIDKAKGDITTSAIRGLIANGCTVAALLAFGPCVPTLIFSFATLISSIIDDISADNEVKSTKELGELRNKIVKIRNKSNNTKEVNDKLDALIERIDKTTGQGDPVRESTTFAKQFDLIDKAFDF